MNSRIGRLTALVAAALALLPMGSASAHIEASSIPCRQRAAQVLRGPAMDIVQVRTFTVEAEPLAKTYKIGTTARVAVTVTRPAHRDPLQLGPEFDPPASAPAADVNVGVGIHVGDMFVPGFGLTDADGKVTVAIKLPRYMKPGSADVDAYAWRIAVNTSCLTLEEDGYTRLDHAFDATK